MGRKNHYGSKSNRGTEVAALFYTLLETAKLHGVDPARYLREAVLAAHRREVLLPWQLGTDQPPSWARASLLCAGAGITTGERENLLPNSTLAVQAAGNSVTKFSEPRR